MSRPCIEVEMNGVGSLVRGWIAHELIVEVTGRQPVYVRSLKGWSVQEHTAGKVVSLAESKGLDVVFTGVRAARKAELLAVLMAAPTPLVGGRRR